LFEIDQHARRFTFNLVLQEQWGYGPIQLPIGAVNLASHSPVVPFAPAPSSVLLFVPALVGLLGVLLRGQSCVATSESADGAQPSPRSAGMSICIPVLSLDGEFAASIRDHLHRVGYGIRLASTVDEVVSITDHTPPSLLLIDHRISDWDILRTNRALRHVPLMILVPCGGVYGEQQSMADLERGADGIHDFRDGHRLFTAKVGAYLRRMGHDVTRRGLYRLGSVELDADVHEVRVAGRPVQLSSKPFAILQTLMQAPSKVFSRHELVDRVWGPQFAIGEHTLDVHVHALRHHLHRDPNGLCRLVTIKGVGFKLKAVDVVSCSSKTNSDPTTLPISTAGPVELRASADAKTGKGGTVSGDGDTSVCHGGQPACPISIMLRWPDRSSRLAVCLWSETPLLRLSQMPSLLHLPDV
jgi:two-component system response regulator RegX3